MRSKARHSDRAFLNRSKWIISSLTRCVADTEFMPEVVVQTILSGPNADHHSLQARGGAAALSLATNHIAT